MKKYPLAHFEGTVIRADVSGFGIIEIDGKIDSAEHAFFTENTENFRDMNGSLHVGGKVAGLVEKTRRHILPVAIFEVADH